MDVHLVPILKNKLVDSRLLKDAIYFNGKLIRSYLLVFLLLLDSFLLVIILSGIRNEQRKVPPPALYFPQQCRDHFKEHNASMDSRQYYADFSDITEEQLPLAEIAPICQEMLLASNALSRSQNFWLHQKEYMNLIGQINAIQHTRERDIEEQKNHSTPIFGGIVQEVDSYQMKNAHLLAREKQLKKKIKSLPTMENYPLFGTFEQLVQSKQKKYARKKASYEMWYPWYQYLRMLFFIVPFSFIAWLAHRNTDMLPTNIRVLEIEIAANIRSLGVVINANILLLIIGVIAAYTINLMYVLLFQKTVEEFLPGGIMSLFKYLLIFVVIEVGVLVWKYRQKKKKAQADKAKKEAIKKAILESLCSNGKCRIKVDYKDHKFCPACGHTLKIVCPHCNAEVINGLPYCKYCGKKIL
ncbi:MAG: zinc ribbon domain-containing protein [Sulfuricurvum sp.]